MTLSALHIGKYYPPCRGGMESFLADLLGGLEGQGVRCAALVHSADGKGGEWEGHVGPRVLRVPSYGSLLYAPLSPAFPQYLERAIRETSPAVLHFHLPNPSAYFALFNRQARKLPWVVHWHADVLTPRSSMALQLAYGPYSLLEAAMLRRADVVIASSPTYLRASRPLAPFIDKCEVIPLGIDEKRLPPATNEANRRMKALWPEKAAIKILMVGRFTYYKGHRAMIEALAKVPEASAVLVGTGELRGETMAYAERLGLKDRVKFPGNLPEDDLAGLYANADVLCLPALDRAEAFGMVLIEAMRYEKALIASNIRGSGVPWVLEQCSCGRLVEPGDADSLAAAMHWMKEHPEQRTEMGRQGAAVYREIFKIEAVAEKVAALYRRLYA